MNYIGSLLLREKIQRQEAGLGRNVEVGTVGEWVRGSLPPGLREVCMYRPKRDAWSKMTEIFKGQFFMCQTNCTLLESKWCCFSKRNTHQPGLKQITGCFRQLRILLCLSLLSEFCHVELLVIAGFCHNGQGVIIVGHQREILLSHNLCNWQN